MKQLGRNELCGCGSGRKYKKCCYNKEFTWEVDKKGNLYRQVRFSKENSKMLKMLLDSQGKEFKKIFGREISGEDKIFFNTSPFECYEVIITAMKKAKINPEFIYAFIKTGRLVSKENASKLPDIDLNEWKAAIDDYHSRVKKGENPLEDKPPKEISVLLVEFSKCACLIAYVLADDDFLISDDEDKNLLPLFAHIVFCLKKVEKNLKSISKLLESPDTSGDALNLTRSIYEIYLFVQYFIKYPQYVGSIVAKNKMANESDYIEDKQIHQEIYSFLSSYSHPDPRTSASYVGYADYVKDKQIAMATSLEASITSLIYASFILYEILKTGKVGKRSKLDINLFLERIKKKLLDFYDKQPIGKEQTELIKSRINRLVF